MGRHKQQITLDFIAQFSEAVEGIGGGLLQREKRRRRWEEILAKKINQQMWFCNKTRQLARTHVRALVRFGGKGLQKDRMHWTSKVVFLV